MLSTTRLKPIAALLAIVVAMSSSASLLADVKPVAMFSDHMVLQQNAPIPVWGMADPGEQVTVTLGAQKQTATAGANGKWMLKLAALKASNDPVEMTIAGKNTIKISDILVGEVWIASGQSNMQIPTVQGVPESAKIIAEANLPRFRTFTARLAMTYEPQNDVSGTWIISSPETAASAKAMPFLFGRDLHKALDLPVGIVALAQGASVAEAWISRETLVADPKLKFMVDALDENVKYFRADPRPEGAAPLHPTPINKPRTAGRGGAVQDPMRDQHFATILYNGMIAPVIPYAVKGAIWYQGESICFGTPGLNLYGHTMQTLVKDWRKQWGQELPFYIVQLPGQANISNNPRIREEQATILGLPHTGMAVTIDIGEEKNVHPVNKEPIAARLTKIALADAYGQKIDPYGPMYDSMKVEGGSIRVKFTHVGAGLAAKGGVLKGFQVAGDDKNFVAADAKIDGDSIVISSADVKAPVAVRYAYFDYPEGVGCNLYNAADLPAAPFRSDKWDYPIKGIVEN